MLIISLGKCITDKEMYIIDMGMRKPGIGMRTPGIRMCIIRARKYN